MVRKVSTLVLALCLMVLLAQTAFAGPRDDVVPYYEANGPGTQQMWYLVNTNQQRRVRVVLSVLDGNRRIVDQVLIVNPGTREVVGFRQADDQRGWRIISAHYD